MSSKRDIAISIFLVSAFGIGIGLYFYTRKKKNESFREPIFVNSQKMEYDNYPRANGSIYGEDSHLMSGYPYYDKAY